MIDFLVLIRDLLAAEVAVRVEVDVESRVRVVVEVEKEGTKHDGNNSAGHADPAAGQ